MEAASRYRDTGNAAFRGGQAAAALDAYVAGMSFIDDGMMAQLMGSYLEESSALKAALHSNAAAAALALGRADEALTQAAAALALAPRSAKALFRKGRAHAALGQDDAAREALRRAQELDPQDASIRAALRELDRRVGAVSDSERLMILAGLIHPVASQGGGCQGGGNQESFRGAVRAAAAARRGRRGGGAASGCGAAAAAAGRRGGAGAGHRKPPGRMVARQLKSRILRMLEADSALST
jgi:tetratricopeptide (TPR) repeat protein